MSKMQKDDPSQDLRKKKYLISSRLELETFSVLDWRDNQLHHETMMDRYFLVYK